MVVVDILQFGCEGGEQRFCKNVGVGRINGRVVNVEEEYGDGQIRIENDVIVFYGLIIQEWYQEDVEGDDKQKECCDSYYLEGMCWKLLVMMVYYCRLV